MFKGSNPLRRTAWCILFAAAIGLALTILPAWAVAIAPATGPVWPIERGGWPGGSTPPGWPARVVDYDDRDEAVEGDAVVFHSGTATAFGREESEVRALLCSSSTAADDVTYTFIRRSAGWPCLCLCTDQVEETRVTRGSTLEVVASPWDSSLHRGVSIPLLTQWSGADRRLPVKVLWTGFALNWSLSAALVLALLGLRSLATRLIGRHRTLNVRCSHCGYPLDGLATSTCPECGQPLAPATPPRPA